MKRAIATLALAVAALVSTMAHGQREVTNPGVTVPLMLPASDSFVQSFVRIVNRTDYAGEVRITAIDDGGNADSVTIRLAANQSFHFNSGDLTDGNTAKGIRRGLGSPQQGDWRLRVETTLDIQVLSYIRTPDGFLTPMHDVLPVNDGRLFASTFNPASNSERQSKLRLINYGGEDETLRIHAWDDNGTQHGPVFLTLPAGHSRTLSAIDLEEGTQELEGTLGDGVGKWQLRIYGNLYRIVAQNLLYSSSGHISNLSRNGFSVAERVGATDHSDSISGATELAPNGQPRSGRLVPFADVDYFKVVITEPGTLWAYTNHLESIQTKLHNSTGRRISDGDYVESIDVDAGTYFVSLETPPDSLRLPDYNVYADFATHRSGDDHGNQFADATILRVFREVSGRTFPSPFTPPRRGGTIDKTGSIDPADDIDYFRVEVDTPGRLSVGIRGLVDFERMRYHIYDGDGNQILSSVGQNIWQHFDVDVGTYFVSVEDLGNDGTFDYYIYPGFIFSERSYCDCPYTPP